MAEDPSQIREAIEETRGEIAVTMEALGQKADVKGRVKEGVREKTAELKDQVASSAEQVKAKLSGVQEQARDALPDSAHPAVDAAVSQVRTTAGSVAADPRQRAIAIGAAVVVLLMMLRRRRRRR